MEMRGKKLITVSLPCYNENENIEPLAEAIIEQFETFLPQYDYRLQFIDNCSTDGTRNILEKMCSENRKIRAIFNVRNFGGSSGYYGLMQAEGDCVITIPCDFQVPVDLIPKFVKEWEMGGKIVYAIKTSSEENRLMWCVRSLYYKLSQKFSDVNVIPHYTGAGLYDRSFLELCRKINDPVPSLRQIISTLGYNIHSVEFVQPKRKSGKSKSNLWTLLDTAINRFIHNTQMGPRFATLIGFFVSLVCALIAVVFLVLKLVFWQRFAAGIAPILIGIFFCSAVQLFFIGLIGEYIISINTRLMARPLVIEEKRINFEDDLPK